MFFASDQICNSGSSPNRCNLAPLAPTAGAVDGANWSNANRVGTNANINVGYNLSVEGSSPFPLSTHGSGVNTAFCDGSCRFLKSTIDGTVYSKLITPAGSRLPDQYRQMPVDQDAFAQ
jgi:prepilin-type processing-associated H-X9-DG protein